MTPLRGSFEEYSFGLKTNLELPQHQHSDMFVVASYSLMQMLDCKMHDCNTRCKAMMLIKGIVPLKSLQGSSLM